MEDTLNLQLFADGGAASGDGAGAQAAAVQGTESENASFAGYGTDGAEADASDGQLSGEDAMQEGARMPVTPKERAEAFEAIIKGEYKAEFDKRVQSIINERFKSAKTLEAQMEKLNPVLELIGKKYGVDAKNVDKLMDAIESDDSLYEEEAMERGLTIQQLKEFKRIEAENAEFKRSEEERARAEQSQKIYAEWVRQGDELKKLYPGFDLRAEAQNESFMRILRVPGMDVRTAFEVAHRDELIAPAMQYTAQQVSQAVTNNIRAKGARPMENGAQSRASIQTKPDVSKLTNAQMDEIYRRVVERGERNIRF